MHRLLVVGFSLAFFHTTAQSITTPYSDFGIGEINGVSLPHQSGMAGVGVSMPHTYYVNLQNPALLTYNFLTSFQVGITTDLRSYTNGISSASDATSSISHMLLAVPLINNKWTSAVSLLPYSSVNYDLITESTVVGSPNDSVTYFFSGSGGLSQVGWSHGFRLFDKLNLGLRGSYVFGSITKNIGNQIVGDAYQVNNERFTNYSDFVFTASLAFKSKLADERFLHYGVIYDFAGALSGEQSVYLNRLASSDFIVSRDTISSGIATDFQLPASLSFGVTYEKVNRTLIALDIKMQQWGDTNASNESTFKNTFNVSLGGQITPDYKDVDSYFKRVDYRFGVSFNQLPYLVNETDINEIGINFGISFPTKNFSSVDAGMKFGSRGTTDNNLIRENFAQIVFGLTINDRWFIKRRYD
jgi:hypothetical protein